MIDLIRIEYRKIRSTELIDKIYLENSDLPKKLSQCKSGNHDRNIKNLSIMTNLAKSRKSDLTNFKKSNLTKTNFAKVNYFETNYPTLKAQKIFIHLQK